jgi:hypothetical protein
LSLLHRISSSCSSGSQKIDLVPELGPLACRASISARTDATDRSVSPGLGTSITNQDISFLDFLNVAKHVKYCQQFLDEPDGIREQELQVRLE